MGFCLCHPKSTTALHAEQLEKLEAVPTEAPASASAPKIPLLVEPHDTKSTCPPAPPDPSPVHERELNGRCSSLSRSTIIEGCGNPGWAPGTRAFVGRDDSAHRGTSPRTRTLATDSIFDSSFQRGSDVVSRTLNCPSAAHSSNTSPLSLRDTRAGKPGSLSVTDMHTIANGVANHTRSISGPADALQLSSILRPSSGWTNSRSPLTQNRPPSTEHWSSSQSSGPQTTLVPSRGSVCFLGSDGKAAEPQGTGSNEVSHQGDQDRLKETSDGARTSAGTPTAQGNRQRVPRSLIAGNGGADGGSPKKKTDPKFCSPAPTAASVSRETPSPWPSVEGPPSSPSHHNGVFNDLAYFCFSENSDQSGVFYGNGGSGEMPPAAPLLTATSRASQSPKSILLRPSANTSGAGGLWTPQCPVSLPWQDSVSSGLRRVSRRRKSEQDGLLSERRPSFDVGLPHRPSSSGLHRSGRDEDSGRDDAHIIASVRRTMMRLQRSDGAGSVCSNGPSRHGGRLSSADINARALRTAERISVAMLSVPKAVKTIVDSKGSMSCSATSDSGSAETTSGARAPAPDPKKPTISQ
ncbi:hypothetical protein, unknown function [Leishmania donovani]|uniref:Uncharacterized protein n=1 Tax=Leishmania donovani TaxID=5661 RepID=A0A3Q8IKC7_LEIDO|nr:hypothetical protein, unknown function [Leishmania donovani]AYU81480.1 hypothetical protein LdCL_310035300 [Leishmania donovani]TPP42500.1 hypothetical protein CGC21_10925 [Leishmania donovani]CBZ36671.1 hypothetical protein, unknown function [Leishmania donovani]